MNSTIVGNALKGRFVEWHTAPQATGGWLRTGSAIDTATSLQTGRGSHENLPRPCLPMVVSPFALAEREWPAGSKSSGMTTEPSVSKNGWLLPSSQPVYPLAVPSQRAGYLTCNECLSSLTAVK